MYLSIGPLASLIAGVLILVVPRLLNYIVAIYLILIGLIGLLGVGSTHLRRLVSVLHDRVAGLLQHLDQAIAADQVQRTDDDQIILRFLQQARDRGHPPAIAIRGEQAEQLRVLRRALAQQPFELPHVPRTPGGYDGVGRVRGIVGVVEHVKQEAALLFDRQAREDSELLIYGFEPDDRLVIDRGALRELLVDTGAGLEALLREFCLLHCHGGKPGLEVAEVIGIEAEGPDMRRKSLVHARSQHIGQ